MFFGTQDGRIVQADVLGSDYSGVRPTGGGVEGDATYPFRSYPCTYVGGWETFGSPPFTFTLRQMRCAFTTRANETFLPFLSASINYLITLPPPPDPGPFFQNAEVWDEGLWGSDGAVVPPDPPPVPAPEPGRARWDQPPAAVPPVRSTLWVSIGEHGLSHAPTVQVTVFQENKPSVELLGISMLAEKAGYFT